MNYTRLQFVFKQSPPRGKPFFSNNSSSNLRMISQNRKFSSVSIGNLNQQPCLSLSLINYNPYAKPDEQTYNMPSLHQIFLKHGQPDNYWIPRIWPKPQKQEGPTCGLNALSIALNYVKPDSYTLTIQTENKISPPELLKVLKQNKKTTVGEIFDIHTIKTLADNLQYSEGKAEKINPQSSENDYIQNICYKLKSGYSVITSVDLGSNKECLSPGNSNGYKLHWGLLFGFFSYKNEYYFPMTQWDNYYLWSANKLYQSNKQIPLEMTPEYLEKLKKYQEQYKDKEENLPELLNPSLRNFRFTLFSYPTYALRESVNLSSYTVRH
jgi:hypothetical protein